MTTEADFDALTVKTINSNGAMADLNALYGAAFELAEWHFIPRGELPKIYPYIAADPQYANNEPMIRAFTDTERLARFAAENNLARPDGSCDILSVPTEGIIDYLEQFTKRGATGIWFNSDTKSEGFFIPLKQLRPVKAHLDKLARGEAVAETSDVVTLIVQLKDGLMLPSGFVKPADYMCHIFCRVPPDWVEGEHLKAEYLERVYAQFYGAGWRAGNSDGSRYVLFDSYSKVFPPETVKTTTWLGTANDPKNHFWYFIADAAGQIRSVSAVEFQRDVDESLGRTSSSSDPEPRDSGIDDVTEGEIGVNQVGLVNYYTSLDAFYEAFVSLLADYKGSGPFNGLLAFDPRAVAELVESTDGNAHGPCLRFRRFLYHNPKNNARLEVHSIHGNQLRHVETGSRLLLSFDLCKNLDNQSAALYFAFLGEREAVRQIAAAIRPALAKCGYEPLDL